MFRMFYMLQTYVSSVSSECFISRSRCCKRFFKMFQVFDTYVAIVSFGCCTCFTIATHMFSSVSSVFANVSDVCCKYFRNFGHILQVFHLNVSKVDQNAPHVAMCPTYHNLLLHLLEHCACA
jgi:hypothetical protein